MTDALRTLLFKSVLGGIVVKGDQLKAMTQAAEVLATTLSGARMQIIRVALNSFLPEGHVDALKPVRTALVTQWPTFASEVPDGGLPYLRAVCIMALLQHAEDSVLGSALYLLLVDPLARQGEAREAELREHVLALLRSTYLRASAKAWASIDVAVPNVTVKAPEAITVPKAAITEAQESIETALQTRSLGTYHTGYQSIKVQVPSDWATEVSTAVTGAFGTLTGQALAPLAKALGAPLNDVAKFGPTLADALKIAKLAERRMNVMWWMQARYSPSREVAYRTLGSAVGAFRMGHDLDSLVPSPAPPEVEAVLLEAWHVLFGEAEQETLTSIMKRVATGDPLFQRATAPTDRGHMSVLTALEAATNPKLTQKQVSALTGVAGNAPVSSPELALWIFRIYQAQRLLK